MKKLLTLLLLSPLAFADITELACTYTSTFYPSTGVTEKSTFESISVSIDSASKTARTDGIWLTYKESGNEVSWTNLFSFKAGDTLSMANRFRLDRITGQLEQDFMTKKFPNGITPEDYAVIRDFGNYDLRLVHTLNCKKVEAIF